MLGVLQADMFSISDRFLETTGTGNVYARQLTTIIMTVLKVCFSAKLHVKILGNISVSIEKFSKIGRVINMYVINF